MQDFILDFERIEKKCIDFPYDACFSFFCNLCKRNLALIKKKKTHAIFYCKMLVLVGTLESNILIFLVFKWGKLRKTVIFRKLLFFIVFYFVLC